MVSRFAEDDISSNVRLLRSRLRKVARHARLSDPESDPDATAKAPDAAALPHRNLACMRGNSARAESRSARERASREDSRPPLGSPAAALRRARPADPESLTEKAAET